MSALSRRSVLLSAPALAASAVGVLATAAAANVEQIGPVDEEILTIRRLIAEHWKAVEAEINLENKPGHAEAIELSQQSYQKLSELSAEIFARPVTCWMDVVKRAEILQHDYQEGGSELLNSWCPAERRLGNLLNAVLDLGGRHV